MNQPQTKINIQFNNQYTFPNKVSIQVKKGEKKKLYHHYTIGNFKIYIFKLTNVILG